MCRQLRARVYISDGVDASTQPCMLLDFFGFLVRELSTLAAAGTARTAAPPAADTTVPVADVPVRVRSELYHPYRRPVREHRLAAALANPAAYSKPVWMGRDACNEKVEAWLRDTADVKPVPMSRTACNEKVDAWLRNTADAAGGVGASI